MKIRIRHDYVLVRLEQNSKDATGILLDQDYEKNKHVPVHGKVVEVPQRLRYTGREAHEIRKIKSRSSRQQTKLLNLNTYTVDYDTDMELEVGDEVWLEYTAVVEAQDKGLIIDDCLLIRYDGVVVAKRGNDVIPVNGHLLVEQIEEPEEIEIARAVRKLTNKAVIRHLGNPVRHYRHYATHIEYDDVQVGDLVRHRLKSAIPLEMPMYQKMDKPYYYLQRKDILCKETT